MVRYLFFFPPPHSCQTNQNSLLYPEHTTYSNVIYVFLTLLAFFVILFEAIAKGGNLIPRLSVEDPIDIEEVEEGEEEREHNGMAVSWRSEATLEPQPFQRLL